MHHEVTNNNKFVTQYPLHFESLNHNIAIFLVIEVKFRRIPVKSRRRREIVSIERKINIDCIEPASRQYLLWEFGNFPRKKNSQSVPIRKLFPMQLKFLLGTLFLKVQLL